MSSSDGGCRRNSSAHTSSPSDEFRDGGCRETHRSWLVVAERPISSLTHRLPPRTVRRVEVVVLFTAEALELLRTQHGVASKPICAVRVCRTDASTPGRGGQSRQRRSRRVPHAGSAVRRGGAVRCGVRGASRASPSAVQQRVGCGDSGGCRETVGSTSLAPPASHPTIARGSCRTAPPRSTPGCVRRPDGIAITSSSPKSTRSGTVGAASGSACRSSSK